MIRLFRTQLADRSARRSNQDRRPVRASLGLESLEGRISLSAFGAAGVAHSTVSPDRMIFARTGGAEVGHVGITPMRMVF